MKKLLLSILLCIPFLLDAQIMFNGSAAINNQPTTSEETVVDILGWNGASNGNASYLDAVRVFTDTPTESGYIDSIYAYMAVEGVSDSIQYAIYADNGSNYPGALLAKTPKIQGNQSTVGWHGVPLLSRLTGITGGTQYWIGYLAYNATVYYNTTTGTRYSTSYSFINWGMPATYPTGATSGTAVFLIYANIKN